METIRIEIPVAQIDALAGLSRAEMLASITEGLAKKVLEFYHKRKQDEEIKYWTNELMQWELKKNRSLRKQSFIIQENRNAD